MRKIKSLVVGLALAVGVSGCEAKEPNIFKYSSIEKVQSSSDKTINYSFIGKMSSKLDISLVFTTNGKVAKGEITYLNTKAKQPIVVIGKINKSNILLYEFDKFGNITGIIKGNFGEDNFIGQWSSPKGNKTMDLKLKRSIEDKIFILNVPNMKNIYGSYKYSFPNNATGTMEVKQKNNGLDFFITSTSSSFSVAELNGNISMMNQSNKFLYGQQISKNCLFSVDFYDNFSYIHYIDDKYDCDFGLNAGVDGVYYKIDKK